MRFGLCAALIATCLCTDVAGAQDEAFARCLAQIRRSPAARAITAETWERHLAFVQPDAGVLASLNTQPEFTLAIWDYFAVMADDERIREGQARLREHAPLLAALERQYGVDPAVLVAIWGIESDFGRGRGGKPVVPSLATLSCEGRRQRYFRGEFLAALRILQRGDITPERFTGSWAGAFGHTQFMPGTFEWLAVDHDGDGRRDVVDNIGDALASTAHFLKRAGRWRAGESWGYEVRVPAGFSTKGTGRAAQATLATWRARGVVPVASVPRDRMTHASTARASLLLPSGARGPAFLAFQNFRAVFRYNAAESYALAILHLADRIRGQDPLVTAWPTDDLGLSRADRRELQSLLGARGHPVGNPTAVLTPAVVAAVRVEQLRLGHPVTGRPGQRVLGELRGGR
jgi:lytic murein transglycosylase